MGMEREQEVRELAYRIWEQEGCLDGYDVQHWLKAEALWQEEHRPKSKPKRSKPINRKKTRKTSAADREL